MNGTLSRRMPLINFHKFNLLLPIQAWVSSTLFGGRLSFMSMQFTESKYEQHTTEVSGPYYLERWKHQHCTSKSRQTRPHWKSKLYFWMRPCKSSTRTINSDRLQITNQNPQAKKILPSLLSPPTNSSTVSRYWFDDSNARKFIGYKKDLYDVNQQPIRYLAVPFTCPNALCNSSLRKRVIAWDPNEARAHLWDKSISQLELWRDMQVIVFCVCVCAQLTSGTSPTARIYLCRSCVFFPVVLAARQRSHLWSCFTVHSSGFSPGKIAPGTPSSFSFTFSFFFLSIPPSILLFWAVLSPLKHSAWLPPCQCLHLRPP